MTKAYLAIYITVTGTGSEDGVWTMTPPAGRHLDEPNVYSLLRSLSRSYPDAEIEVFESDHAASIQVTGARAHVCGTLKQRWRRFSVND